MQGSRARANIVINVLSCNYMYRYMYFLTFSHLDPVTSFLDDETPSCETKFLSLETVLIFSAGIAALLVCVVAVFMITKHRRQKRKRYCTWETFNSPTTPFSIPKKILISIPHCQNHLSTSCTLCMQHSSCTRYEVCI